MQPPKLVTTVARSHKTEHPRYSWTACGGSPRIESLPGLTRSGSYTSRSVSLSAGYLDSHTLQHPPHFCYTTPHPQSAHARETQRSTTLFEKCVHFLVAEAANVDRWLGRSRPLQPQGEVDQIRDAEERQGSYRPLKLDWVPHHAHEHGTDDIPPAHSPTRTHARARQDCAHSGRWRPSPRGRVREGGERGTRGTRGCEGVGNRGRITPCSAHPPCHEPVEWAHH